MKKQLISLSLIAGMLLFAGCDSDDESSSDNGDSAPLTENVINNDSSSTPTTNVEMVSLPYTVTDNVNLTPENTEDVYTVGLKAGVYAVSSKILTNSLGDGNNFRVDVYNAQDEKIASLDQNSLDVVGEAEDLKFTATTDNTYTIKIWRDYHSDTLYSFTLYPSVVNGLVQDAKNEYNNFIEMATSLTFEQANVGVSSDLNLLTEDKRDYYSVDLDKTGTYAISAELLAGTADEGNNFRVKVYNTQNEEIAAYDANALDNIGEIEDFTFAANLTGKYKFLFFRDYDSDTLYNFRLFPSIENGLVQGSDYEFNDFKEMATPLTYTQMNSGINSNLNVTTTDKEDWFSVNLEAATYDITAELLAGTNNNGNNLRFKVYDTQNQEIAAYDANALDAEGDIVTFSFTSNLAGEYKILVFRDYNSVAYYKYAIEKK